MAAFRAFDADPAARAAVLWGEGGHIRADADLTAIATESPEQRRPAGVV